MRQTRESARGRERKTDTVFFVMPYNERASCTKLTCKHVHVGLRDTNASDEERVYFTEERMKKVFVDTGMANRF